MDPMDDDHPTNQSAAAEDEPDSPKGTPKAATKRETEREKSEREKRTYRACLHCRQRKSRCDLYSSGEPGRPPCERCIREQHECILGGSRRGGRRVKRTQSDMTALGGAQGPHQQQHADGAARPPLISPSSHHDFHTSRSSTEDRLPTWIDRESRILPPLPTQNATPSAQMTVDDTVAATDLQNPADALEFLANVAERDSGSNLLPPIHGYGRSQRLSTITSVLNDKAQMNDPSTTSDGVNYPPLARGQVSFEMIQTLLNR